MPDVTSPGHLADTPGRRLAGGAFAFLRAAELLHEDDPASWAWATCFVNVGFALELALKGFIREKGGDEKDQKAVGHDLWQAFLLAIDRGFKPSNAFSAWLVREISPHFKDMSLRYLIGGAVELPPISQAIGITRLLILDVHEQCGFVHPVTFR